MLTVNIQLQRRVCQARERAKMLNSRPLLILVAHGVQVVLICGVSVGKPAYAASVTALSQVTSDKMFTLTNNGTAMATVEFILAGVLDFTPAMTGTGSASGSFSGSLMEGTTLLFTAPLSGNFDKMLSFDISAGASIILASSGMVTAMASASSPSGSATAIASDSGTSSFLTSSSDISLAIAAIPPSSYMLAVTGDSPLG